MTLSPSQAASLLRTAYFGVLDERASDPLNLELLVQALRADPALLEAAWSIWASEMGRWSEPAILEARYWVDVVLIGGPAHR